ncbi:MAG: 2-C-methyl-D-erythritol 4-phosphate cytidylyltransferase [Treponema sp.]|nr:2-C-methyl-D-erythritol 4-phosphate cytidylyltransferase [Treponema sp.]
MCNDRVAAVILAGGSSARMNGIKKEYFKLKNGVTVLQTAVSAFISVQSIQTIVIVTAENSSDDARYAIAPDFLNARKPEIIFVTGGNTRRASVYNALLALSRHTKEISYVLIHDGARPWVSPLLIENIITAVKRYDAVIPLLMLTDTPKEIDSKEQRTKIKEQRAENKEQRSKSKEQIENNEQVWFINKHLKRANTGVAQTPQAFKFADIFTAHEKAAECAKNGEDFTDDAEIWSKFCGKVAAIPGETENRKITYREDLI